MHVLSLDDSVIRSFEIGAVFSDQFDARINSLDFHRQEDYLVTASDDDSLQMFDVNTGRHLKTVSSRKYGCRLVTYTHHINAVLTASARGTSHALRYLSLHDNRWLRYFEGHSRTVTSVEMSPARDLFLSAAEDQEVRLWDLRVAECQGILKCPGIPSCATDQQGLIFGVSADCGVIKLFDVRGYDKGPFSTFAIKDENCTSVPFTSMKFSYDGQKILAVNTSNVYVLEAFHGQVMLKVNVGTPEGGLPLEASFTPDGKYVTSGCYDNKIRVWRVDHSSVSDSKSMQTPEEVHVFEGHTNLPTCLKWSPKKSVMASGCVSLALWIPDLESIFNKNEIQPQGDHKLCEDNTNDKERMQL